MKVLVLKIGLLIPINITASRVRKVSTGRVNQEISQSSYRRIRVKTRDIANALRNMIRRSPNLQTDKLKQKKVVSNNLKIKFEFIFQ